MFKKKGVKQATVVLTNTEDVDPDHLAMIDMRFGTVLVGLLLVGAAVAQDIAAPEGRKMLRDITNNNCGGGGITNNNGGSDGANDIVNNNGCSPSP
ncbi:g9523 [Coccomyxa viridis]|uniref:G9523 protein n=1 Tax=Coccomyxa viridis TaxID=1274662 RepID=A0ABP1G9F1_9CHLO